MSGRCSPRRARRMAIALAAVALASAVAVGQAAAATRYVSPKGSDAGSCARAHPCRTIVHAVAMAGRGDSIRVASGVYRESVTIAKRLHLRGVGRPTIDAAGHQNGIVLAGAGASGSSVRGFRVVRADQEGILAMQTSWIVIRGNWVAHNDLGMFSAHPTGECAPQGEVPGDCGEGIHLMTVSHAWVLGNAATANAGGILLTDELGPSFRNVIAWNHVWRNAYDCGITIPGHNPGALSASGRHQPAVAGIYDNLIVHNTSNRNGLKGEGAGILLAVGPPGGAVYDNVIAHNTAVGNELAGVTMHLHAPNQDLNGNRIIGNRLVHNNLGGDSDAGLRSSADLLVFSAVVPIRGTVVRGNTLADAHFGVWTMNGHVRLSGNRFRHVQVPVHQS